MSSKKKILFFIGARGNSKGLRKKNIKKIGNRTLLDITISQAKKSKFYNRIAVSSESSEILKLAKEKRVDLIIKRPNRLSKDQSSKFDVWKHAIKKYEEFYNSKLDILVELDCTNPLRKTKDVDNIIIQKIKNPKIDAVLTVGESKKNPYFNMVEENKKKMLSISKKINKWPTRRQDAPKVFELIANTYCFEAKFIKKKTNIFQGKLRGYVLPKYQAIDIDEKFDFDLVEYIYKKYKFK